MNFDFFSVADRATIFIEHLYLLTIVANQKIGRGSKGDESILTNE
jgi:hypothetical protein